MLPALQPCLKGQNKGLKMLFFLLMLSDCGKTITALADYRSGEDKKNESLTDESKV